MSVRRHIGNPEVRARSRSENRRGRAYRKRLHVGREYVDFRPPEGGKPRREEGSGGGREGEERAWGTPSPGSLATIPHRLTVFVAQRSEVHEDTSPFPQRAYSLGVAVTKYK